MSGSRVTQRQWDRAWNTIVEVRDRCPRTPGDASTDDIVDALVDAGLIAPNSFPDPEHAVLADGTVLRHQTARALGITNRSDEARWTPPPDPDDLLARLSCGCDPDQGHHTCQPGSER